MATKFSFNGLLSSLSKIIAEGEPVEKKHSKTPRQKAHEEEIQNAIIVLAAEVIRCNKNYTTPTENFISEFLAKQFGAVGIKRKVTAINNHLHLGTEPVSRMACKELKLLTTYDSRLIIITFLFGVADIDDFINAKEIRCIRRVAGYLDISEDDFKEIKTSFTSSSSPFVVLDIHEDASMEQIKTAYRKMLLKFHPDKREAHISIADANAKFRQIQRAFEVIKQMKLKP